MHQHLWYFLRSMIFLETQNIPVRSKLICNFFDSDISLKVNMWSVVSKKAVETIVKTVLFSVFFFFLQKSAEELKPEIQQVCENWKHFMKAVHFR